MSEKKVLKYNELPDFLKNDEEVIEAVLNEDISMINNIPFSVVLKVVRDSPEVLKEIRSFDKKLEIIQTNLELAKYLSKDEICTIAYATEVVGDSTRVTVNGHTISRSFIKLLPEEMQCEMILGEIKYTCQADFEQGKIKTGYSIGLEDISENVVIRTAILEEDKRVRIKRENPFFDEYEPYLFRRNLSNLSIETQIKLLLLNNEYKMKVSYEAIEKFFGENPLFYEEFIEIVQARAEKGDEKFAKAFSQSEHGQQILDNVDRRKKNIEDRMMEARSIEEAKNVYLCEPHLLGIVRKTNVMDKKEWVSEMLKMDPKFLGLEYGHFPEETIIEVLCEGNPEIKKYFYKIKEPFKGKKIERLVKILTNDDIMAKLTEQEVIHYLDNPSNENLASIVETVYGKKSAQIVRDRPRVDMDVIPNMYVFHPDIVEEFSIGATHATLSYKMPYTSAQFSELARSPEKMQEYRRFAELTKGVFADTAIELEDSLFAFENARELLAQIPEDGLEEQQKANLTLALRDLIALKSQSALQFPATLEGLSKYGETRDALFEEAIKKSIEPMQIKNLICQRFFGMKFYMPGNARYEGGKNTVTNMCRFYNLGEFIKDPITIESGIFSRDDLDALELLDIMLSIRDVNALKEISSVLSKMQDRINPLKYKELSEMVRLQYSQELVDSLITPQKAEQMVLEGQPGISITEKDGIRIVKLEGVDFYAYVTNPNMRNSELRGTNGMNITTLWQEFENGITTWSGCLINQDEMRSTVARGELGLGTSEMRASQVVVMNPTDAHVSHDRRQLEVTSSIDTYNISFSYPEKFMEKSTEAIDIDSSHKYNEVASNRRIEELHDIHEGTYGGKTMPDYIYAYGKGVGETKKAIEMAKSFGIGYIFECNDEAYARDVSHSKETQHEEVQEEPTKEESKFIRSIRDITRGGDDRGGR